MKLDRRQFLTGCLATAAAGCATTNAKGAKAVCDPNLVALISDIHVALPFSEQKYRTGREYPHVNNTIQKYVSEILALRPLPANVVALGDISLAFAEEKEYALCLCPGDVRCRHEDTPSSQLFPLYRAKCRDGHQLPSMRRQGLFLLQAYGMGGNIGLRYG